MPAAQLRSLLHLFYPHVCETCGTDALGFDWFICNRCLKSLPKTHFENIPGNPVEKIFSGRINITEAHSEFFYTKGKRIQHLIHALKYKGNFDAGKLLGELLAQSLINSSRFKEIDYLIPLPLNKKKEFKRGFNQAAIICEAMSDEMKIPVLKNNLIREKFTQTQTQKHRMERWENVEGSFMVLHPEKLENKKVLLVDDVLTTGATLEAAATELLQIQGCTVSLATAALASK